jgi:hypothetical protein
LEGDGGIDIEAARATLTKQRILYLSPGQLASGALWLE